MIHRHSDQTPLIQNEIDCLNCLLVYWALIDGYSVIKLIFKIPVGYDIKICGITWLILLQWVLYRTVISEHQKFKNVKLYLFVKRGLFLQKSPRDVGGTHMKGQYGYAVFTGHKIMKLFVYRTILFKYWHQISLLSKWVIQRSSDPEYSFLHTDFFKHNSERTLLH